VIRICRVLGLTLLAIASNAKSDAATLSFDDVTELTSNEPRAWTGSFGVVDGRMSLGAATQIFGGMDSGRVHSFYFDIMPTRPTTTFEGYLASDRGDQLLFGVSVTGDTWTTTLPTWSAIQLLAVFGPTEGATDQSRLWVAHFIYARPLTESSSRSGLTLRSDSVIVNSVGITRGALAPPDVSPVPLPAAGPMFMAAIVGAGLIGSRMRLLHRRSRGVSEHLSWAAQLRLLSGTRTR
jgi:hypothetical protein